jgi:hypothetical protein
MGYEFPIRRSESFAKKKTKFFINLKNKIEKY